MTDVQTNGLVKDAEKILGRSERVAALRANGWKLELDGDQWVQLCDPAEITEGNRQVIKEAMFQAQLVSDRIDKAVADGNFAAVDVLGQRQAALAIKGDHQLVALFVRSWSFDIPVPNVRSVESMAQIPGHIFDRLHYAVNDLKLFLDASPSSDSHSDFSGSAA